MKDAAKVHWWALLLPMLAVLIWSLNITVTRYVADYISPVSISFYRWLVAFLVLTPFILPQVWKHPASRKSSFADARFPPASLSEAAESPKVFRI